MSDLDKIWYTRCPVPTASGLAHALGWLTDEFAAAGVDLGVLHDAGPELADRHYDHRLQGLFREGGNVPAMAARAEGAPTRLIGLTWIDEWQSILVLPDSGIVDAASLPDARIALPRWAETRARSFPRAMALHGVKEALAREGLALDEVTFVEVPASASTSVGRDANDRRFSWPGLAELAEGKVDAVYVKGARAAEQAKEIGGVVAVDLDAHPDPRTRVNNGTPRPITVHEDLLAERPDVVVAFLAQSLRAAEWATEHLAEVRLVLGAETRSGSDGVATAYRGEFHRHLHPDLSVDRLDLLERQKDFLLVHGFLAADVDIDRWVAHEPLERARERLAGDRDKAVA